MRLSFDRRPHFLWPNCQAKLRQIAKRKCAKLPSENAPNCQIFDKNFFYFRNKT
jgi:hypothetical protein